MSAWTVRELMERLSKEDPEARVKIRVDGPDGRSHPGHDLVVEPCAGLFEGPVVRICADEDGRGFDQLED